MSIKHREEIRKLFRYSEKVKLKIVKKWTYTDCPFQIGDIVEVERFGTYGCYDANGNWVDFYCCQIVYE